MAASKQLSRFVRDALVAGQSREDITEVLVASGWSVSEAEDALREWADTPSAVPVPRPQVILSAKDFFIYALTFGLLIFVAIYLTQLLHALIDITMDEHSYRSSTRIRWSMAVLIVTLPSYLWLTLRDRAALGRDPAHYRSVIRKWLTYITLLVAASVMLGDLVSVIYAFLNGDFTLQFMAKALVVGVVAGGIFLFYLSDIRKGDAA